jgi:hypothetical protein
MKVAIMAALPLTTSLLLAAIEKQPAKRLGGPRQCHAAAF